VTKGLDPAVPMKDSGIEWLGEIPAHWKLLQFRRFSHLSQDRQIPQSEVCHHTLNKCRSVLAYPMQFTHDWEDRLPALPEPRAGLRTILISS
jgi:hypothetical protein